MSPAASLVWLIGALVLAGSAFRVRRIQGQQVAAVALAWAAIGAVLLLAAHLLGIESGHGWV